MNFSIEQNILVGVLQNIQGPTTFKQNFPILNSILIEVKKDKIFFTSTDLDITIIANTPGEVYKEGKVAVPARRFISIIKELPKKKITIEFIKNNLLIKCEKIEFKITTINPQEFPFIEEIPKKTLTKLSLPDLIEMIRLTSFCVGFEDVNYILNGILFELYKNKIKLVSTDGKRLAYIERQLPPTQAELNKKLRFIFPIKGVNEFHKLLKNSDEVFLSVEEGVVSFDLKNILFIFKPIEGEFPNYSQYIPPPTENKMIINRNYFLSALRRADILSTPDHQGVKMVLKKEEIIISKITPQLGEVKETIPIRYNGPHLELGFNPDYLIDVLRNLEKEEIEIEFYGSDKPAVLREDGYIYLVLPMKI